MLSKLIVDSPWYYFVLSFVIALLFSGILYYRNKKNDDTPKRILWTLSILRFLSAFLIFLTLLNILLRTVKNETENPIILFAVDNSSSMVSGKDSAYVRRSFQENMAGLTENLEDKFTVKRIRFGREVKAGSSLDFSERETDIEQLFREIENNYSNQNIGALIMATDGIYNRGANPLYSTEKFGFPIYTIAMGDTVQEKDIILHKVNHNEVVYAGNNFPVEVAVHAKQMNGKQVTVSLSDQRGVITKQNLTITSDDYAGTCSFTLQANTPGLVQYRSQVSVLTEEINKANNARTFVIEVINNKEKILLVNAAPHPDIAAIRDALGKNENYELELSAATKQVKPYGLVILHGLYAAQAEPIVDECISNKVPYWIINQADPEGLPGFRVLGSAGRFNDAEPYVDPDFSLFSASDELKRLCNDLPAVKTFFGKYQMANGASSFISQRIGSVETENPILVFSELNELKTAVFAGDGLWKWKMRDFLQNKNNTLFNELISKTVQYLAVKSDKSFFRLTAPKIISENSAFELQAELYNKSYQLITEPEVTLILTNQEGKKFNYTFSKLTKNYQLNVGLLAPGEYKYEARAKSSTDLFVKQGIVIVKEVLAEKINNVANHRLLFQLAEKTNGKLIYPNQVKDLEKEILNNEIIKPITYSQSVTNGLIDVKWLFFLILVLLAIEWFFRKRYLII